MGKKAETLCLTSVQNYTTIHKKEVTPSIYVHPNYSVMVGVGRTHRQRQKRNVYLSRQLRRVPFARNGMLNPFYFGALLCRKLLIVVCHTTLFSVVRHKHREASPIKYLKPIVASSTARRCANDRNHNERAATDQASGAKAKETEGSTNG